jgi:Fe-S cluster biogenesis protein NfuA
MTNKDLQLEVEKALSKIRPFLKADGGDISIVKIEDEKVYVQFEGACSSCSINQLTFKNGVEETIKKYVPQVKEVIELVDSIAGH